MKLTLNQIKEISVGAARIEEQADGFHFYRFTEQQEALYRERSEGFYQKTFCTSGIKFYFRTDSRTLALKGTTAKGTTRSYFSFELYIDGKRADSLNNFAGLPSAQDYTKAEYPLGEFSKEFGLGEGEKELCLYFPWSVCAVLQEVALEEGASIKPLKSGKKLLCFGDSITQGYDALQPGNRYAARLAKRLDADEYNKAIGGEIYFPALAAAKEDFEPDYVLIAYGSNDWSKCTKEELTQNCRAFLYNASCSYPKAKIFAVTPIWRKDMNEVRRGGAFLDVGAVIAEQAAGLKNVAVIQGFDFVPKDESFFADLRLHPNDEGFAHQFKNLAEQLEGLL